MHGLHSNDSLVVKGSHYYSSCWCCAVTQLWQLAWNGCSVVHLRVLFLSTSWITYNKLLKHWYQFCLFQHHQTLKCDTNRCARPPKMWSLTSSQSPEPAPRPNPRWTCRPSSSRLADWPLRCIRRRRCTSGWRDFLLGGQGDEMWGVCCFNIWWEGCDVKDKVECWQRCSRISYVYFWWLWNLKNTSHESAVSQRSSDRRTH